MPRVGVWLAGATVVGGLYLYALPSLNQEVHQYVDTRESSVLTGHHARDREKALDVHRLYAALVSTVDNAKALASAMGQPAISSRAEETDSETGAVVSSRRLRAEDQYRSQSLLQTNKDILLFYCDVQRLKSLLLRLPVHVQTAEEKVRLWRAAEALEAEQCGATTWLHFRDEPLRWSEWCRCVCGFVCYWVVFRLVPFIWCCDCELRRRLLHAAARCITDAMEVDCEMTVGSDFADEKLREDSLADVEYSADAWFEEEKNKTAEDTVPPHKRAKSILDATPPAREKQYVLLNAQHWIEEVGFWACHNNPLIVPASASREGLDDAPPPQRLMLSGRTDLWRCVDAVRRPLRDDASGRRKLWSMQHGLFGAWALYAGPSRAAVAESTPYELHWSAYLRPRLPARDETAPSSSTSSTTTTDALEKAILTRPVTSTLGYPLLSDTAELPRRLPTSAAAAVAHKTPELLLHRTRDDDLDTATAAAETPSSPSSSSASPAECKVIPVGLAGLPRLLYVNAITATPDVPAKRTKNQMYDYVYREQYKRDPARARGSDKATAGAANSNHDETRLTRDEAATFKTLHGVRVHGGFYWWSPLWWGRVYGGATKDGSRTRRVLRYHVGNPCTLAAYDLAQLDATVKATTEGYATS